MLSHIKRAGLACTLLATLSISGWAQAELPEGALPMIVTPHNQSIDYTERTLCYDITANVDYEIACDADWVNIRKGKGGELYIYVPQNYLSDSRQANIVFANTEKGLSQTMTITQGRDESVYELPTDIAIKPSSATANTYNSDGDISKSYDDNLSTIYHSQYSGSRFTVSETTPAILTYNFTNVDRIDYINYIPRQSGSNGNFGKVEIYIKKNGDADFTLFGSYDWNMDGTTKTVDFGDACINPASIQFKVLSGYGDFASCAEMQFRVKADDEGIFDIFADDLYTTLKPGTTSEDIEDLSNPFAKSLATQIFNGTYDTNYRVASYPCYRSVYKLSDMWNAPGKYYDQNAGVTGINITKGRFAVACSGIPEDMSASLNVVAWYVGIIGDNFDGGNPHPVSYPLKNGLNIIDYDYDWDGLAYVAYYSDDEPSNHPDIKVHFINGQINGYLSPDKSNEEMQEICANAKNICMDVVGKKVHSVWTSEGLYKYCKASDGTNLGYKQYMNLLDSLIVWEHRSLGFEKYDRIPTNRTMAYVNYTYYMFQGSYGVSFHVDQESRVLNCQRLMNSDDDAIWGLSHEWGHQHQMTPYFCWTGMTEVTNNVQSYYNIMKMGYRTSDKIDMWAPARRHFLNDYEYSDGAHKSDPRLEAYNTARASTSVFSYSPKMRNLCLAMQDNTISAYSEDPTHALSINEVSVGETLCPFIMLDNYFVLNGYEDFSADWYEALRQNDDELGSQVEKQGFVDKYELLASAQNDNKNGKFAEFKAAYPQSCWVTDKYITDTNHYIWDNSVPYIMNYIRKVSRLSGYNLLPYFERWGFLRQIALYINDYGNKWYVCTPEMYNEFVEDMDALVESGELKAMPEGMVEEISNTANRFQSKPVIPNE